MTDLTRALAAHPFCAGMADEHVRALAACASEVHFSDGQRVAREGQPADATYLLRAGRIVLRSGATIVETVEEDEVLGWSWLFPPSAWHVDADALGVVRAIRLDGPRLDAAMHADPAFGHALARRILRQVHRRLERARLRSLDVFGGAP